MKAPALVLMVSFALNAILLTTFAFKPDLVSRPLRHVLAAAATPASASTPARGQPPPDASAVKRSGENQDGSKALARFWSTLESDDLPTLIARLRAAGFSPAVVRSIINARVGARLAARMKALTGSVANTPYWKPEPMNSMTNPKFFEEMNQIYRDRSRMLRELLGDDFFAVQDAAESARRRQFGDIPKQKVDLVQRVADDYAEMASQVRAASQGIMLPEDREKLAVLEREKRADLTSILTPEELDAYEMRNSTATARLRPAFTLMNATEEEFRAIYKAQQAFTDVLYPTFATMGSPESTQQRRDAQQQVAEQIKAALGDARFADYVRSSNYEFQQLSRLAQRENIPTDTIVSVYNLRDTVARESNRIASDDSQTPEQKRAALQTLAQNTKGQIMGALGMTTGNTYVRTANWLTQVEQGVAITFGPDGMVSMRRPITAAPTPSIQPK